MEQSPESKGLLSDGNVQGTYFEYQWNQLIVGNWYSILGWFDIVRRRKLFMINSGDLIAEKERVNFSEEGEKVGSITK